MRLACFAGLLFGTLALACSDSDTIVSLNVCTLASVDAESIESLDVNIEGAVNQAQVLQGVSILPCGTKPAYFRRIGLPEGTEKGTASIEVRALDASGTLVEAGSVDVVVRPEETVAAFIELGEAVPSTGGAAGAPGVGGLGGAAGLGGANGEAGAN